MSYPSTGSIASVTFTPAADGILLVTATYDVQVVTGSDWGPNVKTQLYCTQNSTTTYSDEELASTARGRHADQFSFNVVAGLPVTFGLYGAVGGAATGAWWNVTVVGELKKR